LPVREGVSVIDVGTNVVVLDPGEELVLVDSGPADATDRLSRVLEEGFPSRPVSVLFNTHYHGGHTGGNETFGVAGATIVAHENTRLWMATDYWVPGEERYERARPDAAHPAETFYETGSRVEGGERIDFGYLIEAHTSGDIYVFFRDANVIALGDVASPVLDPALDYFTGAWIGGRRDAMHQVLGMCDEDTLIVPGTGPVMTRAEFQAETDMMTGIWEVTLEQVRLGWSAQDMLESGVLDGFDRTWEDPYVFLDDLSKGLWAHHNKLAPNVV
jgi:glyoxylase-like metal-dependent hydrolase (beta-lactamase superfamily II)